MSFFGDNTQKTSQNFEPWGPQGGGFQYGWGRGRQLFDMQFGKPFDPYGATSKSALAGMKGIASGPNPFLGPAMGAVTGVASGRDHIGKSMFGDFSTGEMLGSNPFADKMLADQNSQIGDQIKASMSGAGRFGSGKFGEGMSRGIGANSNAFNMNRYTSDRDAMLGAQSQNINNRLMAAGMSPAMAEARYADTDRLARVGAAEDAMKEAIRNNDWGTLNKYLGMFGTLPGSAGTQTTTQPGQSGWLQLLGAGAAGLGGLGSLLGMFGGGV